MEHIFPTPDGIKLISNINGPWNKLGIRTVTIAICLLGAATMPKHIIQNVTHRIQLHWSRSQLHRELYVLQNTLVALQTIIFSLQNWIHHEIKPLAQKHQCSSPVWSTCKQLQLKWCQQWPLKNWSQLPTITDQSSNKTAIQRVVWNLPMLTQGCKARHS